MTVLTYAPPEIRISEEQTCRYMRSRWEDLPEQVCQQISGICRQAEDVGQWRLCYCELPITFEDHSPLKIGALTIPGTSLQKHLSGCRKALLFCASAGHRLDRRIAACRLDPAKMLIWDAAGTAGVEALCDRFCDEYGGVQRSRFSPGYGDLPLELQKDLLSILDAQKKVGVTLTSSLLMTPGKSVTAIVGLE